MTYTKVKVFLTWWDITDDLLKGSLTLHSNCTSIFLEKGASKKNEPVTLMENALGAFETLKKPCIKAPVLAFANFEKLLLLKTDTSKQGLEVMLSQKQMDGWYHPVAYVSQSLNGHECNYHSTK